jgi:hypothetical protein
MHLFKGGIMRKYKVFYLNYPNSRNPTRQKLVILRSLTKLEIDKLNNKYDSDMLHASLDTTIDLVTRKQQIKKLENKKLHELVLMFMVNKPKGNLNEQIEFLVNNFYTGWLIVILRNGYALSNFQFVYF